MQTKQPLTPEAEDFSEEQPASRFELSKEQKERYAQEWGKVFEGMFSEVVHPERETPADDSSEKMK